MSEAQPHGQADSIQRGKMYLATQVISHCRISKHTLQDWVAGGLRFKQPGTKQRFFLGDDIIDFIFGGDHE